MKLMTIRNSIKIVLVFVFIVAILTQSYIISSLQSELNTHAKILNILSENDKELSDRINSVFSGTLIYEQKNNEIIKGLDTRLENLDKRDLAGYKLLIMQIVEIYELKKRQTEIVSYLWGVKNQFKEKKPDEVRHD